jgi:hypothetical protein
MTGYSQHIGKHCLFSFFKRKLKIFAEYVDIIFDNSFISVIKIK